MAIPTPEQQAIIKHPLGQHARVLAVAGSGKTTTMVLRVRELVLEQGVDPVTITVLMFNRFAKEDFEAKLERWDLSAYQRPKVHTFHSFALAFIYSMRDRGIVPRTTQLWIGDLTELVRITLHRAIEALIKRRVIRATGHSTYGMVDVDRAEKAIGLWKGSLIAPAQAGIHGHPDLPLVYQEFEALRTQANAMTFDDFVPMAVRLMEGNADIRQTWTARKDHVIVDEYQDVNYGQQRLIELMAGTRADVMVVGDDDQTIYEWRGARPHYMIRGFQTAFGDKPHIDYQLTHSFRFGPLIAQCAANVIGFNTARVPKKLIAHDVGRDASIEVVCAADSDRLLVDQMQILLQDLNAPPPSMIVLGRTFAQLAGIEVALLFRRVPYRVLGSRPFFERGELITLLNYVRISLTVEQPLTKAAGEQLLSIANTPNRFLRRDTLDAAIRSGRIRDDSAIDVLTSMVHKRPTESPRGQHIDVEKLLDLLEDLRLRIDGVSRLLAGDLLQWLIHATGYMTHFDNYYGQGENSEDRKEAVRYFVQYARDTNLPVREFLRHIDTLDSTQGAPLDQQITLTTIFRTKGLEYDYVFIPRCDEGAMPNLVSHDEAVFDNSHKVPAADASPIIENERRLFYVGMTRTKKCVFIGTSADTPSDTNEPSPNPPTGTSSRFLEEMQLDSVAIVTHALQSMLLGNSNGPETLLSSVGKFANAPWLRRHFFDNYLAVGTNQLEEALVDSIAVTIAAVPVTEFAYQYAYRGRPTPSTLDSVYPAAESDPDVPF